MGMVCHGMVGVWYGMAWHGKGMVGMSWHCIVRLWHGMVEIWYGMAW